MKFTWGSCWEWNPHDLFREIEEQYYESVDIYLEACDTVNERRKDVTCTYEEPFGSFVQ